MTSTFGHYSMFVVISDEYGADTLSYCDVDVVKWRARRSKHERSIKLHITARVEVRHKARQPLIGAMTEFGFSYSRDSDFPILSHSSVDDPGPFVLVIKKLLIL